MNCITTYYYNGTSCPLYIDVPHFIHAKECLNELMTKDLKVMKLCGLTRQDLGDGFLKDIKQMEEMICKASNYERITGKSIIKAAKKWIETNYKTTDLEAALGIKNIKDYQYAQMFAGNWNDKICKLLLLKRIPNNDMFGVQEMRTSGQNVVMAL